MEILAYIAFLLIGISLGIVGSGGSILTVPVLVYLAGIDPLLATTSSLFIVGSTSLLGAVLAFAKKQVDVRSVMLFGIPSVFSILLARQYLLPAIPDTLFSIGDRSIGKSMFLMILFAILMLAVSILMILQPASPARVTPDKISTHKAFPLILIGLFVGVVTGLLGAGGGFLIIPALVLLLRVPVKTAIGTSLFIIAMNSLFGFLVTSRQFEFNWPLLLGATLLAITGMLVGRKLGDRIPSIALKKGFGWFVLLMGLFIITKELFM
jgi:uncharacterized protein